MPENGATVDHPRHVVAVMGVVFDGGGRVLLVKRDRRGWEPPGGQVELGEDLVSALKREILEESGCESEVVRLAGAYSNPRRSRGASFRDVIGATRDVRYRAYSPRPYEIPLEKNL